MSPKYKVVVGLLAVVVLVGGALLFFGKGDPLPAVSVTLRIAVDPKDRSEFVAGQANSARFKYLVGKQAGIKPIFAQKLMVKPIANTAILEATVGASNRDEGQLYATGFVELLQALCGKQVRLTLVDQAIR